MLPVKRLDRLARALRGATFPVQWTHLGDGPERPVIEREVRRLPACVRVQLLGHLPGAEVRRYYNETPVDAFVSVSRSEGLPVSLMEATSYGIPCVATDVGGVRELVGEATRLPADIDEATLLAKLAWLRALSVDRRDALRQSAFDAWRTTVDADQQYAAFVEALTSLA
jgi:glycosyltransferase involved in cell wall biosynthesis